MTVLAETAALYRKPFDRPGVCKGFWYIGQPITSCERCGFPVWDHDYDSRFDNPFGSPDDERFVPWPEDTIEAWYRSRWINDARRQELLAISRAS
jgi:hypothetical protein